MSNFSVKQSHFGGKKQNVLIKWSCPEVGFKLRVCMYLPCWTNILWLSDEVNVNNAPVMIWKTDKKHSIGIQNFVHYMSHIMRKPVYAICEQQRRRSACLDSIIPLVSISEISSLYLASVAAQAGLSLPRSQTPKTGFLVTRLICTCIIL